MLQTHRRFWWAWRQWRGSQQQRTGAVLMPCCCAEIQFSEESVQQPLQLAIVHLVTCACSPRHGCHGLGPVQVSCLMREAIDTIRDNAKRGTACHPPPPSTRGQPVHAYDGHAPPGNIHRKTHGAAQACRPSHPSIQSHHAAAALPLGLGRQSLLQLASVGTTAGKPLVLCMCNICVVACHRGECALPCAADLAETRTGSLQVRQLYILHGAVARLRNRSPCHCNALPVNCTIVEQLLPLSHSDCALWLRHDSCRGRCRADCFRRHSISGRMTQPECFSSSRGSGVFPAQSHTHSRVPSAARSLCLGMRRSLSTGWQGRIGQAHP